MPTEVKEWLESRGIECEGLTEDQITAFSEDYTAINAAAAPDPPAADDPPPATDPPTDDYVKELRASAGVEHARLDMIVAHCGTEFPEIKAQAISEGWEEHQVELSVVKAKQKQLEEDRKNSPTGPAIHASSSEELRNSNVFAAALHCNMDPELRGSDFVAEVYGEKEAELSRKLPTTAGLKYLLHRTIIEAGGHVESGLTTSNDLLVQAFRADQKLRNEGDIFAASAFSTFSLTDTLSNIAHKMLMREYRDWPSLVDVICDSAEHTDFKEHSKFLVEGDVDALKLPPTGEIKHGTLSDGKYTNQIYTFARMLSVTRVDFINDDLGAFNRRGRMLGRGQMQAREKLMYMTLLNPALVGTFWKDAAASAAATGQDSGVVNRLTAAGVPSAGVIENAENLIIEMKNETGDPIMVSPEFVLSGTKLRKKWNDLLVSRTTSVYDDNTAAGSARKELRIENEYLGRFGHRDSPYVNQNANIAGSSDNLSFLFGNKRDAAAIEYATLRGASSPTIQSAETDFNTLGTQMRTYWDFGFGMQNPRGAIRIEG